MLERHTVHARTGPACPITRPTFVDLVVVCRRSYSIPHVESRGSTVSIGMHCEGTVQARSSRNGLTLHCGGSYGELLY